MKIILQMEGGEKGRNETRKGKNDGWTGDWRLETTRADQKMTGTPVRENEDR